MYRKISLTILAFSLMFLPQLGSAQPKVVPIGQTIQPEGGGKGGTAGTPGQARKKKAPSAAVLKAGKTFMVESATVMSSGINQQGETVYFRAAEDVGGVIAAGALAQGKITEIQSNKKKGKLVVKLESIESIGGGSVDIGGDVEIEGKGGPASLGIGERFTATVDEKAVVRRKPKKEQPLPSFAKQGFAEIRGKGVKVDIKKGIAKGQVEVLIEPPKGASVDDINKSSLAIYRVNSQLLPQTVAAASTKVTPGDRNKNGVTDLGFMFSAWDFVKYQPRGINTVYFKGKLVNGTDFDASAKASIDY
jgi:hypothetical protein